MFVHTRYIIHKYCIYVYIPQSILSDLGFCACIFGIFVQKVMIYDNSPLNQCIKYLSFSKTGFSNFRVRKRHCILVFI